MTEQIHSLSSGSAIFKTSSIIPQPPLPLPLKTCLFFDGGDSWSFFARTFNDAKRQRCIDSIASGGGNSILFLLTNEDRNNPVNFFQDGYGGTVDMGQLTILENWVRRIASVGGACWPVFFCDENFNASIRNAPWEVHQRAIPLFVAHLRPYVPGFVIGLESSEYFDKDRHNQFYDLIKYVAPDRYVVTHTQSVPRGGIPKLDAVFWEAPWSPHDGDRHSPEELVSVSRNAQVTFGGKYIWPMEYNINIHGSMIRRQSRALIDAGFGCGGPL